MVLKAGLCSLYAARATNLLTRAEPMQRRIQDWGWEAVVFQEGGGKLYTGRVSPSTSDLPPALQSLNQSHLLKITADISSYLS